MTTIQIRPLTADDDMDAQRDMTERAFGAISAQDRDGWWRSTAARIGDGRFLGAFAGGRPVGSASYHDMRQWWAGRDLPMAGVASVKVAPEARGQGLGRQLMTGLLRQVAERGYPLSALYPSTMPIYRSLGWELAGGLYHAVIPTRSLRELVPPDKCLALPAPNASSEPSLRKALPEDAAGVISVFGRAHQAARDCGPLTRDLATCQDWLTHRAGYPYIGDGAFVSYQWKPGNGDLFAPYVVASTPEGVRAVWSLLAASSSTVGAVEVRTSPGSPIWWLLRERDARLVKNSMWMLRVVDARAAIEGRGFPAGVTVSSRLAIIDDALPGNSGTWDCAIADGKATLARVADAGVTARPGAGGDGALALGPRGLAALYAGTPVSTLRAAGLAVGGSPGDDAALNAAFAAQPFMLDDF